jgi:hypothetical protein
MMTNPWKDLKKAPSMVLESDRLLVEEHNAVFKRSSPYHLQLGLPPSPFIGRLDAPVVLLLANPGYYPIDRSALEKYPIIEKGIWENLHLNPEASLFYLSREYRGLENHVNQWWRDRTKELAKWIDPTDVDRGFDTVQEKLLAIEYHPYHSKEWCPPFRTFESQEFTFELVNLAMERNAWIIVGRCKNHWLASVPGLRGYERVIKQMKSSRSVHLSKNNLGTVTFGRIARAMLTD